MPNTRQFGDFHIACLSRADLVEAAVEDCRSPNRKAKLVFCANGHGLSLAKTDPTYRDHVAQADLIHADGGFLVSLSKRGSGPTIPERSATTDMIHDLAERAQLEGLSFYLLGGEERVNASCAEILQSTYPDLKIAGRRHGFFSEDEEQDVLDDINASGADIVWVGLGKPKEQAFAVKWRDTFTAGWVITCGGCYNYITGDYPRAPQWMQDNNLEWVHRLLTNPRKLFWRYAVTTPHALWIALTER